MSIAENIDERNFGKFNCLNCLGEKTLANNLFQINMGIKTSVKLRETLMLVFIGEHTSTIALWFFHWFCSSTVWHFPLNSYIY